MEQLNLHKQKLYALIAAAIGLISMFLPWWKLSFGGFGGLGAYSVNGMHESGNNYLSLELSEREY